MAEVIKRRWMHSISPLITLSKKDIYQTTTNPLVGLK